MNNYLHKDEYVPYAPDGAGEQVRINHADCPAGEDEKRRLYIKRCDDGITILAFCHHCRRRGKYDTFATASISNAKNRYHKPVHSTTEYLKIPATAEYDLSKWPSRARAWLYRYGINNKEIQDYGIFYNPNNLRVGIPSFGVGGVSTIQYRRIFDELEESDAPKYLTVRSAHPGIFRAGIVHGGNICVLTEDAVSAIKCGRFIPAVALTGTYLSDDELWWLVSHYDKFLIFLDDDNADVRSQELVLKNRLDVFGDTRIIHTDKDPKAYSEEELRRLLC